VVYPSAFLRCLEQAFKQNLFYGRFYGCVANLIIATHLPQSSQNYHIFERNLKLTLSIPKDYNKSKE